MRAKVASLLALLAVGLVVCPPFASAQEDIDYDDEDYGDMDYDDEDYGDDEDYDGYDDEDYGGGAPAQELKELIAIEDMEEFLNNEDASVIGFFAEEGDDLEAFKTTAQELQYDFRFGWTTSDEILAKYTYKSAVVVFKPPRFVSDKYDKPKARFPGKDLSNTDALKIFAREKSLPLVGQYTYATRERYTSRGMPIVKVFFDVDYDLNPKGSNYYVNRVRKVAVDYVGKLSFTIAAIKDYSYELKDYGLDIEEGKRQVGVGIEDGDKRFGMGDKEFSVTALKEFCESFLKGELEPTKVVEPYQPPPQEDEDGDVDESGVTVLDPDNIKTVIDGSKDVMVEFYAPWCGHCKMLKPEFAKLGKEFEADDDVVVAKFDADAHTAPAEYDVQGFPTLFFVPKGGKPVSYNGERTSEAMANFIRENKRS